jgi:hypothetical protein
MRQMSTDGKSAALVEAAATIERLHEENEWLREQLADARSEIAILELQVCQSTIDEWIEREKKGRH